LRSHGSSLGRGPEGFYYLRGGTDLSRAFDWRLRLDRAELEARITISLHGHVITLCRRCTDGAGGTFVLHGDDALRLLNGEGALAAGTARVRVGPAVGGRLQARFFAHGDDPNIG
jgi:hypothetical protein